MDDNTNGNSTEEKMYTEYANNVHFEPSAWDLKIIFGQLDQSSGKPDVDWHTAVTLPWPQVKLLAYYLQVALFSYETENGKINIPPGVKPQAQKLSDELKDNKMAQKVAAFVEDLRKRFIEDF